MAPTCDLGQFAGVLCGDFRMRIPQDKCRRWWTYMLVWIGSSNFDIMLSVPRCRTIARSGDRFAWREYGVHDDDYL